MAAGHYYLAPTAFTDSTCGNCESAGTSVPATYGLLLSGRHVELVGASADSVIIHTNAGYGILFDGCDSCSLRGVTITGGTRDADGRATSAAVVVRRGQVSLDRCSIRDNIGDSATVAKVIVGIAGVAGREQSDIRISNCSIRRNSWDGIALYRGARAEIRDNVIDGVDKAAGGRVGGGRGVGIGLTWDAAAIVERNLVTRYWKGIGVFGDARALIRHNVVEDVLTWGFAYWGAETGGPAATIEENIVYLTGACGAMIERNAPDTGVAPGRLSRNVFVRTTQAQRYDSGEPYCPQRPIARIKVPARFAVSGNLVYDVRQPGDWVQEPTSSVDELKASASSLVGRLRRSPALRSARFFSEYWNSL
ncbi:MAG: right-handed parallel beta-helix repeat-containing protein [Gemmatimonadaceae bacterium]